MTVHELILRLTLLAARNPDAKAVLDDTGEAPGWAEQYPEISEVSRMPDGRIVIR
jgi:hypothetical protein